MSTYAIGDLQGCRDELSDLLNEINYDASRDSLWLTGDLVNRGPQSLEVLRLVRSLQPVMVLGNHDLHLLAIDAGHAETRGKDTLDAILTAPDRSELLKWLQQQPLLVRDTELGYTMVHAGMPPQWSIEDAITCSREVEAVLRGGDTDNFYACMYGNQPDLWTDKLQGWDRIRYITNCLTRIRYCRADGRLELESKRPPGQQPDGLIPWYAMAGRRSAEEQLIFGHWATVTLGKKQDFKGYNVFPMDTGCVWGRFLSALRLDDRKWFSVPSRQPQES